MTLQLKTVPAVAEQRFLSIKDAAYRIGVSPKTIEQMLYRHNDQLPSIKLGRRRLIDVGVLDDFVMRHAS